jgi:hypothetical protein
MPIVTLKDLKKKRKAPRKITYEYVKQTISLRNGELVAKKYKNMKTPMMIKCENCHKFKRCFSSVERGKWCPYCPKKNESSGEKKIRAFLEKNGIPFRPQKKFNDLRGTTRKRRPLKFDYGHVNNKDKKYCIEYDGRQHFVHVPFFSTKDEFEKRKGYDKKKNNYCTKNNISLLRIDYKQKDDAIEQLLSDFFIKVQNDEIVTMFSDEVLYGIVSDAGDAAGDAVGNAVGTDAPNADSINNNIIDIDPINNTIEK